MSSWSQLSKPEYDLLLSYVGCGNFPDADIIVFGNEEGTGGYSVGANVEARLNYFGRDEPGGEYKYCIHGQNPELGFYEPNASGGGTKVERYLRDHEELQVQDFTKGTFNPSIARICLSVEEEAGSWFQGKNENPLAWDKIKQYIGNSLYKPREGIQTALADWRPLPREHEGIWYPQEYGAIAESNSKNPYLTAFNNPTKKFNAKRYKQPPFSDYYSDMLKRAGILKSLFTVSKAKVVLGIGGAGGFKKGALEMMFGPGIFEPIQFKTADMYTKRGTFLESFQATIPLENKTLRVFLIPFPDAGMVFKTQNDALNMLQELARDYIKPALES